MADRSILYRIRAALQGGYVAVASEVQTLASYVGVLSGVSDSETALQRLDGTGIGAAIFSFTGSYSAQSSNISEWFGGKQIVRMRCTDSGTSPAVSGAVPFQLPGSTALNTAFDQLVTAGLPEMITFIIEYTGAVDDFLQITPRASPSPQIGGTSSIIVRSGVAATIEITRTSGTLSNYVFRAIGAVGDGGNLSAGAIRLINPSVAVWNANDGGALPTTGVIEGNAYLVVNAPSDGSGRFGVVMQNGDWVVWRASTFTNWSTDTGNWFVIAARDVRRITALEAEFLTTIQETAEGPRNTIVQGANYADSAGEIRLKIYATQGDYSAADLNTTGDIDEYTDATGQSGFLAIRLTGTRATLIDVLPTLYVYAEHSDGSFTRLVNLATDFDYQGDFGSESDYMTQSAINYTANDTLRIYIGQVEERYNSPDLDIFESNLSAALQAKVNRTDGGGQVDNQRLAAVESKVAALYPLTPDVTDLVGWGDIFQTDTPTQEVVISNGYSLIADYRGSATRYESTGVTYDDTGTNVIRYTGLGDNLYRTFGLKVDAPADQVLLWIVDGTDLIPYIDMTDTAGDGRFRINRYTPATTEDRAVTNEFHRLTRSGTEILAAGAGTVSTYTLTNFAANATNTSRTLQVVTDVYLNGSDTQAGHFLDIPLPADNTAAPQQTIQSSVYLGPLYANRTVTVTLGYTLRVSGSDLLIDITLLTAPSDVTIRLDDVDTILNYTAPATVARVDNFQTFQDLNGDFTFTGETEFAVTFQPYQNLGFTQAVAAAITGGTTTEMNDINTPIPEHRFESVEVPDQTAVTGFEFRTFSPEHYLLHGDVAHLLDRRATQWCYGLAELRSVSEHSVSERVDFTQSIVLIGSPNNTRVALTVDDTDTNNIKLGVVEV